ncbi:imm11 family protein [Archangium gephyra]
MAIESSTSPRFFVLKHERGGSHDVDFTSSDNNVGEAARCPQCGDFIGSLPWLPPHRGTLELYGKDPGDFVRGVGDEVLISERLVEAFRAEGLTGLIGFHPVEVLRVRRQRRGPKTPTTPRYFVVTPVFGGAAVDEHRSRIRRSSPITCHWCRETGVDSIHGVVLEQGSWNGDDIFTARGLPGSIVVSERFADFVARHGFTNMKLTPTEEYTWDPLRRGPPPSTPGGQA